MGPHCFCKKNIPNFTPAPRLMFDLHPLKPSCPVLIPHAGGAGCRAGFTVIKIFSPRNGQASWCHPRKIYDCGHFDGNRL
jgi:hypothetical protein